jgi:hypothetical protein
VETKADETLTDSLLRCLELLEPHRAFLDQLVRTGGYIEVFVGWFMGGNTGEALGSELLQRMGNLGVSLSLDIYGPDPV